MDWPAAASAGRRARDRDDLEHLKNRQKIANFLARPFLRQGPPHWRKLPFLKLRRVPGVLLSCRMGSTQLLEMLSKTIS